MKNRLPELDAAKGLAIILVVWGHIVARATPTGNYWYEVSKDLVYQFHMPFFVFLVGVVAAYKYEHPKNIQDTVLYVGRKFWRLFPAYALFGLIVVTGKMVVARFAFVDNVPSSFLNGLKNILIYPSQSSANHLWFVYLIFLYYLTLPMWMVVFRKKIFLFVICAAFFHTFDGPPFLLIDKYCEFLVYFVVGLWVGVNYETSVTIMKKWVVPFFILFAAALTMTRLYHLPRVWLSLVSIPALLGLAKAWPVERSETLQFFGRNSFPIYLMNTQTIGVVKSIGLILVPWDGLAFLVYAPILFASGLLLPLWIKKHVFRHMPVLDRITS